MVFYDQYYENISFFDPMASVSKCLNEISEQRFLRWSEGPTINYPWKGKKHITK